METDVSELRALGSNKTEYNYGLNNQPPDPAVLERFENPPHQRGEEARGGIILEIAAPEFTSLCPKTGQPDYGQIFVTYSPDEWCLESKSFKLYLMQFRMYGCFHEAIVDKIGHDLVTLLEPVALRVVGKFNPRGGISFHPTFLYQKPQQQSLVAPVTMAGQPGVMRSHLTKM